MKTLLPLIILLLGNFQVFGQKVPVLHWDFEKSDGQYIYEVITGEADSVSGNFQLVETGRTGRAYKPDGFSACLHASSFNDIKIEGSFTVEAWLSQAAYPWNWVPVIANLQDGSQRQEGTRGFYFGVGPKGQLGLELYIEGELYRCITEDFILPLYEWKHIAAVYDEGEGIRLFVDGEPAGFTGLKKSFISAGNNNARIGMNYTETKPSHIHRQFGTLPYWFSIDGAIDEIRVYGTALDASEMSHESGLAGAAVPFSRRTMPVIKGINRFGASYVKLKYYEEWDDQWPIADHPDVVVNFEDSPVRFVFWRGLRYSPAWVSEKDFWMADQSVEAWNNDEGCYEHMQDRHCKYSHVRILENTPARVLVHWRYAPVNAYNHTWNVDEKTGWECWVDEYYYIYPDGTAIRHVEWKSGSLGYPRQFQESIPLTGPGQLRGDVIEKDWVTVSNQEGEKQTYEYVMNPEASEKVDPTNPNIQRHNLRSRFDPFLIFEQGNKMRYLGDRDILNLEKPGSCNHWPVGQAYCDGRTSQASDRPASFLGFPISSPVIHEGNGRSWWNGLYGMTDMPIEYLARLSRSWNDPPQAELNSKGFEDIDYSRSERAYITRRISGNSLKFELPASADHPVHNFVIIIDNPGEMMGKIMINGKEYSEGKYRKGIIGNLDGDRLIVWIILESDTNTVIEVS